MGTANAHTSIRIILLKSCHPELGASGCTIWYARLRAYSCSFLALSLSRLFPCTRYIVDCEPSWLLISLLYLQLVDYMLYSENSYINNRCATRCASFSLQYVQVLYHWSLPLSTSQQTLALNSGGLHCVTGSVARPSGRQPWLPVAAAYSVVSLR